jgi:membrane-associated phospholipid phosphatase
VTSSLVYTFGCYFALGFLQDPERGASLHTVLDDWVPFVPAAMYAYVIVYTSLFMPVFAVRCQRLFRRVALAYMLVVTVSVLTWAVYPVSALDLRGDATALDLARFHNWGLRVNYTLDPPLNLFPSLHVGIAVVAALACYQARRVYGALSGVLAVAITTSTWLVKQHYVLDGLAGAALALVAWAVFLRPYDPGDATPDQVAYGWGSALAFVGLHAAVLAGLYLAFLLDWRPWA